MNHLEKIVEKKKTRLTEKFSYINYKPIDIKGCLSGDGVHIIAEFKRSSPSEGEINCKVDLKEQLFRYVVGGARAISILTEEDFFLGSLNKKDEL